MRKNLKMLRVKNDISQAECAEKLGCCRATYADIENGKRGGNSAFWENVKDVFNVPAAEMWELMQDE